MPINVFSIWFRFEYRTHNTWTVCAIQAVVMVRRATIFRSFKWENQLLYGWTRVSIARALHHSKVWPQCLRTWMVCAHTRTFAVCTILCLAMSIVTVRIERRKSALKLYNSDVKCGVRLPVERAHDDTNQTKKKRTKEENRARFCWRDRNWIKNNFKSDNANAKLSKLPTRLPRNTWIYAEEWTFAFLQTQSKWIWI